MRILFIFFLAYFIAIFCLFDGQPTNGPKDFGHIKQMRNKSQKKPATGVSSPTSDYSLSSSEEDLAKRLRMLRNKNPIKLQLLQNSSSSEGSEFEYDDTSSSNHKGRHQKRRPPTRTLRVNPERPETRQNKQPPDSLDTSANGLAINEGHNKQPNSTHIREKVLVNEGTPRRSNNSDTVGQRISREKHKQSDRRENGETSIKNHSNGQHTAASRENAGNTRQIDSHRAESSETYQPYECRYTVANGLTIHEGQCTQRNSLTNKKSFLVNEGQQRRLNISDTVGHRISREKTKQSEKRETAGTSSNNTQPTTASRENKINTTVEIRQIEKLAIRSDSHGSVIHQNQVQRKRSDSRRNAAGKGIQSDKNQRASVVKTGISEADEKEEVCCAICLSPLTSKSNGVPKAIKCGVCEIK